MSESTVMSIRQLVMKKIRASAWAQLQKSCWYKRHKRRTATGLQTPCKKWVTSTQPRARVAVVQEAKGAGGGETCMHKSSARLCRNEKELMPCYSLLCIILPLFTGPYEDCIANPSSGLHKVSYA